ncbi:MAG TPA: SIR2 family protein [Paludibaculum sp.]|jgi:hypothetical protein
MLDPLTSLAFSVHSNKGVYALLLGSGLSRAAGVPTGWEVVLDLIRQLAHVQGEVPEPEPEVWYKRTFGKEPDYSDLLDMVARSSAERSQLLRSYFEPSEEERKQGMKTPTGAHRAIAELMQAGFIRVVVTTNFDRLLEQALTDLGIGPSVVSTPAAAEGCIPLSHARCTIVKVHGDYLDPQLKNTKSELEAYADSTNALLDRTFDEFGMVVCGWSGDWDIAMRAALERSKSFRFGAFWCVFGEKPSDLAQKLIDHRRATPIKITSADKFFTELAEKVRALESLGEAEHPLSTKLAVARLKRHLSAGNLIGLRDLLASETERTFRALAEVGNTDGPGRPSGEEMVRRLTYYEHRLSLLLALCITATFWAKPEIDGLIVESFRRIAQPEGPNSGLTFFISLRRYPALVLLYGIGLAALASDDYRLLGKLLPMKLRPQVGSEPESVTEAINIWDVIEGAADRLIPGQENKRTPLSNHLEEVLREPLREYLPDAQGYKETFDWWEYLIALGYVDLTCPTEMFRTIREEGGELTGRGPVGCFGWRQRWRDHGIVRETRLESGQMLPEKVSKVLDAGLFGGNQPGGIERFREVKDAFDNFLGKVTVSWR